MSGDSTRPGSVDTGGKAVAPDAAALAREACELAAQMETLPCALGAPPATGTLRDSPEDFVVEEELGFEPSGSGEHLWLWVEKRGLNTDQVARAVARLAGVPHRDVGFAGLKDRHAVARQWFSLPYPARRELPHPWAEEEWRVCAQHRHGRKLRRGTLAGNRFRIVLRHLDGDERALQARMAQIEAAGVPNYFTEQRFGIDNLGEAARLFGAERSHLSPHQRGIVLSSARSALFNVVLAQRVRDACWQSLVAGEAVQLAGSNSFFVAPEVDSVLQARLLARDITPTGPLWGAGPSPAMAGAAQLEQSALAPFSAFRAGLERAGLDQARRGLVLYPQNLSGAHDIDGRSLSLCFALPAGSYATAVIRELVDYRQR